MRGLQNLLVLVIATLLSLGGAELVAYLGGVPLAAPRYCPGEAEARESQNFVPDPAIGWRMRAEHEFRFSTEGSSILYRADREGFRTLAEGDPTLPPREPVTRHIAVTGDSYAWGYGVPYRESFAGLLESRLAATAVRNVAMPGFGVDQAWLALRHYGLDADTDVAIVTLYPDDFERSFSAFRPAEGFGKPAYELRAGELVARGVADCPPGWSRFAERHSRLFGLYRRLALRVGRQLGQGSWWSLNAAILDAIQRDCAERGVPLLFVHIPYETWIPFPALAARLRADGVGYLDLYEAFGEAHRDYYFPNDGHLNAAGHRRLAELIEAWLVETLGAATAEEAGSDR